MPTSFPRCCALVATVVSFAGGVGARAFAAPGSSAEPTTTAGSYTRYTKRLEDEATRILTPEIVGTAKSTLAAHGLDLWGCMTIGEWRQHVLRHAPTADRALTVLVRRTEVLWAEERVTDPYGSTILQLGSVHAMQRGLTRVLEALGVAAPAPVSAGGLGSGMPDRLPSASSVLMAAPLATATPVGPLQPPPAPSIAPPPPSRAQPPTVVPMLPPAAGPAASSDLASVHVAAPILPPGIRATMAPLPSASPAPAPSPAPPTAAAPTTPSRSPYELAAYQGALARESYRILSPEIESGAQVELAPRRASMRAARTVAEWKRLLTEANPSFAKAAAVLERRAEVLRGETKVLDEYDSPHTQRAAVFGLQAGLEKILAQYGK